MNKYKSRKDVPDKYKWDLSDFFKNEEDFNKNFDNVNKEIKKYSKYKGKLKDSNTLLELLKFDDAVYPLLEDLYVYAFLKNDEELGKTKNINRKNKVVKLYTDYCNAISFIDSEIISFSKEEYKKLFNNKELLVYKFLLDEIYKQKGHVLAPNEEIIVNELLSSHNDYEDILSNIINNEHDYGTVIVDGKEEEIRSTNIRKLLQNEDVNVRKEVSSKFKSVRNKYAGTCASLLDSYVKENNTLAKLKKFDNAFDRKLFYRNLMILNKKKLFCLLI